MEILWGEKEFLLFRYLLKKSCVDLKEAEKNLGLSHMTIRAAIESINYFLKKNEIDEIKIVRGKIYFIIESLENFSMDCYFFSTNIERFDYLLIKFLFEKEVVLSKELEVLKVSRITLEKIVKSINNLTKNFNLDINSQLWNGFFLQGRLEDKMSLAIEFIASLLTFKELNPDFYRVFNIENSNIIYKEIRKKISEEDEIFAKNLVLQMTKNLNYEENIFFYHLRVAQILVWKVYGMETKNSFNSKFNYNYSIEKKILKCIDEIKNELGLNLTDEILKKFKNYLYIGSYKSRFKLKMDNLTINDFPLNYRDVAEKIKPIIIENFKNFYDEDIITLIFELRNIFLVSKFNNRRILLIDTINSFSILTKLIKNRLETNYNVSKIDLRSISSMNNWERLKENYDTVFFLNNYVSNIFNKNNYDIKIPYFTLNRNDFIKDIYFFTNYNIELKK